jgi:DNA-binding NarL/FixJ family response regulator
MDKIKILIIQDNKILLDYISALLKKQPDMSFVSTISNSENILKLISEVRPAIVLLDLLSTNENSLEIVRLIKKDFPEAKIIVMDIFPSRADVYEYVQEGVSGLMLPDIRPVEFLRTIRSVYKGSKVLPPFLTGALFSQIAKSKINEHDISSINKIIRLTKRENQVIEYISKGFTNKEIAQQLQLSTYTVKSHVHNILDKLSLSTRVHIAKYVYLKNSKQQD